jgi:branched-chain amino acid transport system substrate-binding protein
MARQETVTRRWTRKRILYGAVLLPLLALGLSACGSSSHNSTSGTTAPASSTGGTTGSASTAAATGSASTSGSSALSGTTYKFGAIVAETGIDSDSYAPAASGYKAWAQYTNAHGGINGHPVEVIVKDDQGTPNVGLADTTALIKGDHVLGITCMCATGFTDAPTALKSGLPVVGPWFGDLYGTTLGHPNDFEIDTSYIAELATQYQLGKRLGGTRAGFINDATVATGTVTSANQHAALDAGMPLVKAVAAAHAEPSHVAECLALKAANVNVVAEILPQATLKQVMDQCFVQGFKPIVLTQSISLSPYWLTDPSFSTTNSGGDIPVAPWFEKSIPAVATMDQAILTYDPKAFDVDPTAAVEAWVSMTVMAKGAAAGNMGDTPTSAKLIAGLHTINNDTFNGLTVPLTYTNGNEVNVPNCDFWVQIQNGKPVVLDNGQPHCASRAEMTKLFDYFFGITK